jgi:hypothetical protein
MTEASFVVRMNLTKQPAAVEGHTPLKLSPRGGPAPAKFFFFMSAPEGGIVIQLGELAS